MSNVVKDHFNWFWCGGEKSIHGRPSEELALNDCRSQNTEDFAAGCKLVSIILDNASMIALESVEWFNLQHIFFVLDKAKAIPIRIRS